MNRYIRKENKGMDEREQLQNDLLKAQLVYIGVTLVLIYLCAKRIRERKKEEEEEIENENKD